MSLAVDDELGFPNIIFFKDLNIASRDIQIQALEVSYKKVQLWV